MAQTLTYDTTSTPGDILRALEVLAEDLPIGTDAEDAVTLTFEMVQGNKATIVRCGNRATIQYHTLTGALRSVGTLLAGLVEDGQEYSEALAFDEFGIMLDCSRNAVMKPSHLKSWFRRLSLLGYNMVMLYTEDTYALDVPYFGYMRGRYRMEELKDLDAYAASLGIELRACIQTLGHLEKVLRYPRFEDVKNGSGCLLIGEEKTYELIQKMLDFWEEALTTKTIHVGMDEAYGLAKGRYEEIHGKSDHLETFMKHLNRVAAMCEEKGMRAMIWSDMLFQKEKHDHYAGTVDVKLPGNVWPVYWDYYNQNQSFYEERIQKHRDINAEPSMGSGVWTWSKVWHDHKLTHGNATPCIRACLAKGLKSLFFTMWGDDGAYCDFDSALAGLAYCADVAFALNNDEVTCAARYNAICGGDYAKNKAAARLHGMATRDGTSVRPMELIWDDPLCGVLLNYFRATMPERYAKISEHFYGIASELEGCDNKAAGSLPHACAMAGFIGHKVDLLERLRKAYEAKDKHGVMACCEEIALLIEELASLQQTWREMWMSHNRPVGYERVQIRLAGQERRLVELQLRLREYLDGDVETIMEFDENLPTPPEGRPGSLTYQYIASPAGGV